MSSAKDEVSRRSPGRRDPRAEPESIPPAAMTDEVVTGSRRDPRVDPASIPAMPAVHLPVDEATAVNGGDATPGAVRDPRFAELEPLFARTAWSDIAARLGPADKAAELPPALGLIYALAQREAAGDDRAAGATELAIRSMAALVGVAPDSDTALVLAKRLLRQNPAGWRTKPAPPARFSIPIILVGIALGAAAGWFATLGSLRFF